MFVISDDDQFLVVVRLMQSVDFAEPRLTSIYTVEHRRPTNDRTVRALLIVLCQTRNWR